MIFNKNELIRELVNDDVDLILREISLGKSFKDFSECDLKLTVLTKI